MAFLILIIGVLEVAGIGFFILNKFGKQKGEESSQDSLAKIEQLVTVNNELAQRSEGAANSLVDIAEIRLKVKALLTARESQKAERGRITITQAELETIENRLRELDEISRELEASALETKEELKILDRKQRDLNNKNEVLKQEIADSFQRMEEIFTKVELSAQVQEQVDRMKSELVRSEQQIVELMNNIQSGNDQYFSMKKRYDALDIEYAQLYEKFSEQQK